MNISVIRELLRAAQLGCLVILLLSAVQTSASAQTTIEKSPEKIAPPAPVQQPQPTPAAWEVECSDGGEGLVCRAVQAILVADTRQRLLSVAISKPAADKNSPMLVQLPHGLFLPAGVTITVDEAPLDKLVIQTCDALGCYAGAGLGPDKIAALSKATKLNVTFEDLKRQKVTVHVPLKGFDAAFKKL